MPEYLSPGVYVEEIDAGPKPISPVATSDAGAVGVTMRGPSDGLPTLLISFADFQRTYGGYLPFPDDATRAAWDPRGHWWHTAESVKAFFDEGGARMYFKRVVPSGAVASSGGFTGGLIAILEDDVEPADTTLRLSHVVDIADGATLGLRAGDGTDLGTVTVASVDPDSRTVTLTGAAGVNARRNLDVALIRTPDTTPLAVVTATASSPGVWGDEVSVRIAPMVGARLALGADPLSGPPVTTTTKAAAAAGDTTINVTQVSGSLHPTTPAPLRVRLNGGAAIEVTALADDGDGGLDLTVPALADPLPAGSSVTVLRTTVSGSDVTVSGAARLYPDAIVQLEGAAGREVLTVSAVSGSQVTLSAAPANAYVEGDRITLLEAEVSVRYQPADGDEQTERFAGLRLVTGSPSSLVEAVNLRSKLVQLAAGAGYGATNLARFPASQTALWRPLTGGDDGLAGLTVGDFIGVDGGSGRRTGIQALEDIDQVAICLVPGMWSVDIRNALIVHCESLADRFAILDSPPGLGIQEIADFRAPIDTKYAALYYPWLTLRDPRGGGAEQLVPSSGFMAGIYARTDVARGVHKAPANEVIRSARGIAQSVTKREQDVLNPQNINVLRAFPGRGNRVWGARVLTSDAAWRYINVRRLFLMVEESIEEGTQWVVFEPNDEPLWARVRQSVTNFLTSVWRSGALEGTSAEEAFFVACDRSTMTQDDIDNGRLICVVGIAPVKPAEFVIFRIQQKTLELTPA